MHFDIVKDPALEKLKSTIDILYFHDEYPANEPGPAPCVYFSYQHFLTVQPITTDDIVLTYQRHNSAKLADIELGIAVGVKYQVFGSGSKARLQGSTVALILMMMNGFYAGVFLGESLDDLCGAVAAAVVDEDDLEIRSKAREHRYGFFDHGSHIRCFVIAREEYAYRRGIFRSIAWRVTI